MDSTVTTILTLVLGVLTILATVLAACFHQEIRNAIRKLCWRISATCCSIRDKIASFYRRVFHRRLFIEKYVANSIADYERDLSASLLQRYSDAFNQANFSHLTLECKDDKLAKQLLWVVRYQGAGRMSELGHWIGQIFPEGNPLDGEFRPSLWAMMWKLEDGVLVRLPDSSRTREFMRLSESMPKAESIEEVLHKLRDEFLSSSCRTGQRCQLSGTYHCRSHVDYTIEIAENDFFPNCGATSRSHSTVWKWTDGKGAGG